MSRRGSLYSRLGLGVYALLVSSVLFLVGSIAFSAIAVHSVHAQNLQAQLNQAVGVATADALSAESTDTTVASIDPGQLSANQQRSADLTNQLGAWVKAQPADQQWSVVVRSLDDDALSASANPDTTFAGASIFKLYLTYALAKTIPFEQWKTEKIGDHTYAECVDLMMVRSDNPCAVAIGNKLGWSKTTAMLKTAGYTHTSLTSDPTTTTPSETAQLLSDMYHRTTFSDQVASFMLDSMSRSAFRRGIVAGCPGCQVQNKTGDNNGNLHDTAIITIDNKHYVLAIFSHGGSQPQIAAATKVVYSFISGQ